MSDSNKKIPKLTSAMRSSLKLKILLEAEQNPEFKKELIRRMKEKQAQNNAE